MKDSWSLCGVLEEFRSEAKLRCKPQSLSAHRYPASVSQLIHVTELTETRRKMEWKILLVTGQVKCKSKNTTQSVPLLKCRKFFILIIYWNRLCIKEGWATKLIFLWELERWQHPSIYIHIGRTNQFALLRSGQYFLQHTTHNTRRGQHGFSQTTVKTEW